MSLEKTNEFESNIVAIIDILDRKDLHDFSIANLI